MPRHKVSDIWGEVISQKKRNWAKYTRKDAAQRQQQ
jgi:hypothetical protein